MKSNRDRLEMEGIVVDFANGKFKIQVSETHDVLCTLSGKIRQNAVKILLADKVRIEVSVYDTSMGRITYRIKSG